MDPVHNFIHGLEHVSIGHAHMEMHISQPQQFDEEKRLMSILMNQCTLTAQFDSKERYRPPRCIESTREDILKKLRDWVGYPDNLHLDPNGLVASLFWLHGGAGAGKSALAQSLAEQLKEAGSLAASFFFFSIDASRNNGDRLFPTIIYQLTRASTAYEKKVIEQLKRNQDIFNRSLWQQMKVLFTEPMLALHAEGLDESNFPRLIVIDGLDECKDIDTQCDILSIIAQTVLSGPLPYPFRFLVSSRTEGHIYRTFESNRFIKQIPVQKYDLSKDSDASRDIRTFLQQEFEKLCDTHPVGRSLKQKDWPSEKDLVELVDRSSGHFMYPATVMRYVESGKHRPDDRLAIVLGQRPRGPKDQPFSQVDALYMLVFDDVYERNVIHIKRALSILYLISEKIGYFSTYHSGSSHIIQDMLCFLPGDLDLVFDPLGSLIAHEIEKENLYAFHKTLFDFLLDQERSGRFWLSKQLCHESAALYMHNTDILTSWSYAPDFMYFTYHCYLAQPMHDKQLIRFIKNLEILYAPNIHNTTNVHTSHQNEKALLAMFTQEGEHAFGAKTIFHILRMLTLLEGLSEGQDLHEIHCAKITQFYARHTAQGSGVNGTKERNGTPESSGFMSAGRGDHDALDEMIRTKLSSWQPSDDILRAITAANGDSTNTDARDILIKREHAVFASFARAQHLSNSNYRLHSTLLPSDSSPPDFNAVVAHSYHIFSVDYDYEPSLAVVLVGTYSRGGPGGVGAVVQSPDGAGVGAGAVFSADWFDTALLNKKEVQQQVSEFLDGHIMTAEKELAQTIDDRFASKFKF